MRIAWFSKNRGFGILVFRGATGVALAASTSSNCCASSKVTVPIVSYACNGRPRKSEAATKGAGARPATSLGPRSVHPFRGEPSRMGRSWGLPPDVPCVRVHGGFSWCPESTGGAHNTRFRRRRKAGRNRPIVLAQRPKSTETGWRQIRRVAPRRARSDC